MSTQKNEQYHILSPEWLRTNPLPDDAETRWKAEMSWHPSAIPGEIPDPRMIEEYDWRTRRTDLPPEAYISPPTDTTGSGREGETPETDEFEPKHQISIHHWADFARKLERQRDAALAKNADLLKSENDQLADIEALTSHITTDVDAPETSGSVVEKVEWLLAQLEALRRDGERLNWLETHPFMAYRDRDPADGKIDGHFTLVDEDRGRKHGRRGIVEPTLRAAIDSAQRQEGR